MSSLSLISLRLSRITDKLAINWKNFTRVRFHLKFAFIIRTKIETSKFGLKTGIKY